METFLPILLPPGFYRNGTAYQGKSRWINGNLVRWHEGALEPVGGWALVHDAANNEIDVPGFPRASWSWRKNDGTGWNAVGTTGTPSKLEVYSAGVLTDITPAGLANGLADGGLSTGSGLFGDGLFGAGLFGGAYAAGTYLDADSWSLDNFGEILVACLTNDTKIYGSTPTAQAAQLANSPTARAVVVTPERFIVAIGASGNPRQVAWASQESTTVWAASATNSAGSFNVQTPGRLIAGRRTARETLLWSDADLWAMVYIGGAFIYSFQQRGDNCGLIGPNAVAIAEGAAYWMGDGQFWAYDGAVHAVPCEVAEYVFEDLNRVQRAKISAMALPTFGEVWWFYPSASQSGVENDRYVAVNYRLGFWMTGSLGRAAASGPSVFTSPLCWDANGKLYTHETGFAHDNQIPFVESGPLELGDGDRVLRIQSLLPDERTLGNVAATFFARFAPLDAERTYGPYVPASHTNVRLTGRQFRVRLQENLNPALTADTILITSDNGTYTADGSFALGQNWRVGTYRVGVLPGGYR